VLIRKIAVNLAAGRAGAKRNGDVWLISLGKADSLILHTRTAVRYAPANGRGYRLRCA